MFQGLFGDNIAYTGFARDTIADINIKLIQYKIDVSIDVKHLGLHEFHG